MEELRARIASAITLEDLRGIARVALLGEAPPDTDCGGTHHCDGGDAAGLGGGDGDSAGAEEALPFVFEDHTLGQ